MAVGNVSADATPCVLCYSIRLDSKRAVPGDADGRRSDGDETRRNHGEETIGRGEGQGRGKDKRETNLEPLSKYVNYSAN